jgi:hypothetical protein
MVELTEAFRAAQAGRGEVLVAKGDHLEVIDQESGKIWLRLDPPRPPPKPGSPITGPPMDPALYALFDEHPEVREALFFDEGHPDAEGFVLFAKVVGEALIDLWAAEEAP